MEEELKDIHLLVDCTKVTETVVHLRKLSPLYDNVLDAIYRDIDERLRRLRRLAIRFPAAKVREEIDKIKEWKKEYPRHETEGS